MTSMHPFKFRRLPAAALAVMAAVAFTRAIG